MSLGTPNVYPGVLSWLGVARELTAGTPVSPVITHPLDQNTFEPEDTPKFLDDKAIRGSMTDLFYKTLGVESATFSFGGPNFLDSHGYFFDNVFGDLSTTSSTLATPATSSTTLAVGATQATLAAAIPGAYTVGASLQLGTATTANVSACYSNEVVTVSATAGSTITFANTPLRFTHNTSTIAGSQIFNVATGPFTHRFAALNSALGYGGAYGAQPPTHTLTDTTNIVNTFTSPSYGTAPTSTYGARQYPSAVVKSVDFSGNAEQLLNLKMAGEAWLSTVASTSVSNITTNSRPVPNWDTTVVIAGNTLSSSGTYSGIGNFTYTPTRGTQVYWTVQGIQTPYIIARGPLTCMGALDFQPTNSEMPLDLMLLNSQAPLSITTTNAGIANAGTPFTLTFTASQAAITKAKIMRNGILIGYNTSFESVANSTDVGGSGGLGPCTLTLVNSTPTY